MNETLRAVLAGCGGISRTWLSAAAKMDDLEIVGLVDTDPESARQRQGEFSLTEARVGTDLSEALRETNPDVVFDCTVPEAHVNITLTALRHGCHVLGEKPLADTLENARLMLEAADNAGKIYAVMQNRRHQKEIRALAACLSSGRLGAPTTLHCDFFIGAHFGGFRDTMKHVLLLDMAIHTFDAARLISGADPVSVYCKEWNPSGSWYAQDASAVAVFQMTNGIVYTYRGSWCAEGLHTTWEADWRAICESGSATWDGGSGLRAQSVAERGSFFSKTEDVVIPMSDDPKDGGHAGLIRDFIDCIRDGRTPETVCTDNIKSLAMVFGAIESAEKGLPVQVVW